MSLIKRHILLSLSIIFLVGCGSYNNYEQSSIESKAYNAPPIDSHIKQQYLNAINEVRSQERSCGNAGNFTSAPALRWSNALYKAAYEHSHDMSENNGFGHKGSYSRSDWTANVQHLGRGSNFRERIENNGYKQWKKIAENIAMGSPTLDMVMDQWLTSDQHCANIMNSSFTHIGMASVKKEDSQLSIYWTQNFAAHQ